jgi:mannose-6-phosphate isomerase-like protein (cupin superfamily)
MIAGEGRHSAVVLGPDEGRTYAMPTMRAVFKADGAETADRFSVSEWWLDPQSGGPGPHSHEENDEIFYVIEGTPSLLVGTEWMDAPRGSFILIPAGITHDFANRTDARAGLLNVFIPGGFEARMPSIVEWFAAHASAGA